MRHFWSRGSGEHYTHSNCPIFGRSLLELVIHKVLTMFAIWLLNSFRQNCKVVTDESALTEVKITQGMETLRGQWLILDTFFQKGRILVNIFWGRILVRIFCPWEFFVLGEFSIVHGHFYLNYGGHLLMVITNNANIKPLLG